MATLIPTWGACNARMRSGKRRLAERLMQKLDDDYLLWYEMTDGRRAGQRLSEPPVANVPLRALPEPVAGPAGCLGGYVLPYARYQNLTLPQIDRVRWILFPQVRIPVQTSLFDEAALRDGPR